MIFLTGGTGFLGHHLVAQLCNRGYPVRVLTRAPEQHTWLRDYRNVEVVVGDLRDSALINDAVVGCTEVIHAASLFSFWGDEEAFQENNVGGTQNVLNAAILAHVKRFVYVSTVVVIGDPLPDKVIDEQYPPNPVDPYQRSKLQSEQLVLSYCDEHDLPAIIVRPGAFYGPGGNYAFNRLFFRDAMRGLIVLLNGGHYITFPVYISDVARGILQALNQGRAGEIYNLCGELLTHREVFKIIREEAGLRWPSLPMPGGPIILFSRLLTLLSRFTGREPFYPLNLRSVIFNNWRVSSEKARQDLDFETIDFRTGAQRTIDWYRQGRPDTWWELDCDDPVK